MDVKTMHQAEPTGSAVRRLYGPDAFVMDASKSVSPEGAEMIGYLERPEDGSLMAVYVRQERLSK